MQGAAMLEMIIVIVMVCIFFIVAVIINSLWDDMVANDEILQAHPEVTAHTDNVMDIFGFFTVFLFGGSLVAMIISSLFMESHPIFLAISVIVFIVSIPLIAIMSNVSMETATSSSSWETIAEEQAMGTQLIGNLVLAAIVGGVLIMVALYAKFSSR